MTMCSDSPRRIAPRRATSRRVFLFVPALLLLAAGCRSAPDAPAQDGLPAALAGSCAACIPSDHEGPRIQGTVAVVGSEPLARTVLRREGAGSVALGGERISELRRLASVQVEVALAEGAAEPGAHRVLEPQEVAAFRILAVRGEVPVTGHLYLPGGDETPRLHTDDGERLRLPGFRPPGGDRDRWHGAAVWVLGEREADRLNVSSHGLIRPGPDAPERRTDGERPSPRGD